MTSRFQKSASSSPAPRTRQKRKARRSLKLVLSRRTEFRPLSEKDIRYYWAAYQKGAFSSFGEAFPSDLSAKAFRTEFVEHVLKEFDGIWTPYAETKQGFIPVGMISGILVGPVMIIGDMVWFPWASDRNIYESAVNFINTMRKEIMVMDFAAFKHKPFFDSIARLGILRHGCRIHGLYPDGNEKEDANLFYSVI